MGIETVSVEALPLDLPTHFEVDISGLENLEDTIHVGAITVPANVTLLTDPDVVVLKIASPRVSVDEEEEAAAAAEGEEPTEEAEGEEPAAEAESEESSES
jgi:large subunit ribosomal protein L25